MHTSLQSLLSSCMLQHTMQQCGTKQTQVLHFGKPAVIFDAIPSVTTHNRCLEQVYLLKNEHIFKF